MHLLFRLVSLNFKYHLVDDIKFLLNLCLIELSLASLIFTTIFDEGAVG